MKTSKWIRSPRGLLALFLVTGALLVCSLLWLGWQLVRAEREVAAQHMLERRETGADLAVSLLGRALSEADGQLEAVVAAPAATAAQQSERLGSALPADCILIVSAGRRVDVQPPGRLPYLPFVEHFSPPASAVLDEAARIEARSGGHPAARALLQRARVSGDAWVRTTALARLGRIENKSGNYRGALAIYDELARAGDVPVESEGLPASLFAAEGRLLVFGRHPDREAARRDAGLIADGLKARRWRISRGVYEFYAGEAGRFLSEPARRVDEPAVLALAAVAASVAWAPAVGPGRRVASESGVAFVVLQRAYRERQAALILGKSWLVAQLSKAGRSVVGEDVLVTLTAPEGAVLAGPRLSHPRVQTVRLASATGLPFNLQVVAAPQAPGLGAAGVQQRLLMTGLGSITVLVLAGIWLVGRAVSQELATTRLQSDFVGAVSHEFRTPLSSLCHISELLEAGRVAGEGERAEYYGVLARESQRLRRLVEGLLNFGRIEAGAMQYRMETIDPLELVRDVVREFGREVSAKGWQIELEMQQDTPLVRADRSALACALWNLLDNAVKYSPACRSIWVTVAADPAAAVLRVSDRGIGIQRAERARIFEKFVRGSSAGAGGIAGTGVGLALVKHIVSAHGGQVVVQSEPGEGSTFTITLPAAVGGALAGR